MFKTEMLNQCSLFSIQRKNVDWFDENSGMARQFSLPIVVNVEAKQKRRRKISWLNFPSDIKIRIMKLIRSRKSACRLIKKSLFKIC